jgi:hypothetical protein
MAKFTFKTSGGHKNLSYQGEVAYERKGQIFTRRRRVPPKKFAKNPGKKRGVKTEKRSQVRGVMREISDRWHTLSTDQRNAWGSYATAAGIYRSGYHAFTALNMRLKRGGSPCFSWVDNITCPPLSYNLPTGICTSYIERTASFCIVWASPICVNLFIQAFEWIPPGKWQRGNQPWKYVDWAISSAGEISVPVTFLDTGRFAQLTIRTINLRGEISSFPSHQVDSKIKQQSGIYGYSYYAYSTYGP